jgi:GMP synthase (glutamine-hydrolysing)
MIYALTHAPHETVGVIGDALRELNLPMKCVNLFEGDGLPRDTSDLSGLIVMGGPMSVNDVAIHPFLFDELQLIEKVLAKEKPVLGICLGAQLIAKALGSKVYPNRVKEIGWHTVWLTPAAGADALFKESSPELPAFHWHGETFDLPAGAVHLARSSRCENQAFRWGRSTYGFQFHLEVTPSMIEEWCASPSGKAEIREAGEEFAKITANTGDCHPRMLFHAKRIFSAYFGMAFDKLAFPV